MARLLACLRIAAAVTVSVATLASGWWGFTLPSRSRTGWVASSWFLWLSHALILHDPFCLVALSELFPNLLSKAHFSTRRLDVNSSSCTVPLVEKCALVFRARRRGSERAGRWTPPGPPAPPQTMG